MKQAGDGKLPKTQWVGRGEAALQGEWGGWPSPVSFLIKIFGKNLNCIKTIYTGGSRPLCSGRPRILERATRPTVHWRSRFWKDQDKYKTDTMICNKDTYELQDGVNAKSMLEALLVCELLNPGRSYWVPWNCGSPLIVQRLECKKCERVLGPKAHNYNCKHCTIIRR